MAQYVLENLAVQRAYHTHVSDSIVIDPAWVLPEDCSHTLKSQSLALDGLQVFSAAHLHDATGLQYDDDFVGTNGSAWSSAYWDYQSGATTSHFQIQGNDGRMYGRNAQNSSHSLLHTQYIYSSDFDIRARYDTFYRQAYNQAYLAPGTWIQQVSNPSLQVVFWWGYYNGDMYASKKDADSTQIHARGFSSETNYWMRLWKDGSTVRLQYRSDASSSWTTVRTITGWTGAPPYQILANLQTWTVNPYYDMDVKDYWVFYPKQGEVLELDSPSLLEVKSCQHSHVADKFAPITGILPIDDAYHVHAAENVIIDPAWVYPADCYHTHAADDFDLGYQFWINFTDYPSEQQPTGWTERWAASHSYLIKDTVSRPSQKCILVDSFVGTIYAIFSWDAHTGVKDADVLFECFRGTTQNSQPCFALRGSGGYGTGTAYYMEMFGDSGSLRLRKTVNGSHSTIASSAASFPQSAWYYFRFRVQGTSLKAKVWAEGAAEPAAWTVEGTDSDITDGGWMGFLTGAYNAAYWYVEHLSVRTGGLATANNVVGTWDSDHDLADDGPITLEFPPVTLGVNEAYHVHAGDNIDFGTITTAVAEAYHLNVADAVALSVPLVVAETYHEHVPDNIDLGNITLSVAEAYHLHDAEGVAFPGVLEVFEAHHVHVADSISPFSIYGASHDHVADALTYFIYNLVTNEAYHLNVADSVALNLDVAVQDAFHLHDADSIELILAVTLTVAECYHVLSDNDGAALDLKQVIAVASAYHLHVADQADITTISLQVAETYHAHDGPGVPLIVHLAAIAEANNLHVADALALLVPIDVAESSHSLTSDVVLLQLPIDESYHTMTSDQVTVTITTVTDLVVEDGSHFVESTDVRGYYHLRLSLPLLVAESAHTHAAENCAITTEHNLAVIEAAHVLASDNIEFNQAFLGMADCSHAVTSDLASFVLAATVAESSHVMTSEVPTFTHTYVMTIADSAHVSTSDTPGIHPWLSVAGADHVHAADALAITQDCWLVLSSENYHDLVSDQVAFRALPRHGIKYTYVVKWRP